MPDRIKGVNTIVAKLADGSTATYHYHRATGTKLPGEYGSREFIAALAEAQKAPPDRDAGTLAGLIRAFQRTTIWDGLADSTKVEYRRVFRFWEDKFGTLTLLMLTAKGFRRKALQWHAEYAKTSPREADNRLTILARVLAWGARDDDLERNVLDTFTRAYDGDRSEIVWEDAHIQAFLKNAGPEMTVAMMLALHTGQRQADILKMAWSNYDGERIVIRQNKSRRGNKPGKVVTIRCTSELKAMLDTLPRRGALILTRPDGRSFDKSSFGKMWRPVVAAAELSNLHFHDIRGTTVTLLFEGGCTVGEAASITGHTLATAQQILDRYLARRGALSDNAIIKLENRMEQERAKRAAKWQDENGAK